MKTILAGLAITTASFLTLLAPAAHATSTTWGAIAYSPGADQNYVIAGAWSYSDAQTEVLNYCGYSDCVIEITFDTCAAVAYSPSWQVYNYATGSTRADAEDNAERYTDSYPVLWGCN
ncbi:DUF4189 domain-containing protein [Nocardia sp. NPDC059240]|uniref:DUF4189 domain-containing protein n=1 Tax=Nocardia sp. NPDC059240 TaxID=3346786 RepID=UPI0036CFCA31